VKTKAGLIEPRVVAALRPFGLDEPILKRGGRKSPSSVSTARSSFSITGGLPRMAKDMSSTRKTSSWPTGPKRSLLPAARFASAFGSQTWPRMRTGSR
jgi:hypothetical protein